MMQRKMEKYNLIAAIVMAGGILSGSAIGYGTYAEYEKEEAYYQALSSLYVHFSGVPEVEYGTSFNPDSLISETSGDLRIEGDVDVLLPGQYSIKYIVSLPDDSFSKKVEKEYERIITVKDTQKPVITLEADEMTVKVRSGADVTDNILSVADPVDGELKRSEKTENGAYTVTSDVDMETEGDYTVKVTALDKNGNQSDKSYAVTVQPLSHAGAHYTRNYQAIHNYLRNKMGLNEAGACGIIANMWAESSFRPDAGSAYYGLCQWGGGRRSSLYSFCKSHGYSASSVEGQCAFLQYELENVYPSTLRKIRNVEDSADGAYEAARVFFYEFERGAAFARRGYLARCYYGQ